MPKHRKGGPLPTWVVSPEEEVADCLCGACGARLRKPKDRAIDLLEKQIIRECDPAHIATLMCLVDDYRKIPEPERRVRILELIGRNLKTWKKPTEDRVKDEVPPLILVVPSVPGDGTADLDTTGLERVAKAKGNVF